MRRPVVRGLSFRSAVCLCLFLAARAVPAAGQDPSGGLADFERVCSIISRDAGSAPQEAAPLPTVMRDRQGRIWAAWEKWEAGRTRVELASFGASGIESSRTVGAGEGYDLAPDLAESPDGAPWVIWVNVRGSTSRVLVLDTSSNAVWVLASEASAAAAGPKILFDAQGSAWAFWSTASGQSGEIVYRVFRQGDWTAPESVPRATTWPAINPDAAADVRGTIWLTWSGYDGRDYRVYLSRWTGTGWAPAAPVSRHPGANLFPSLGFDFDGSPLVAWTRASGGGRLVCLSAYKSGTAGPETSLASPSGPPSPPRIFHDASGPAVGLKRGKSVRVLSLPDALAAGRPAAAAAPVPPRLMSDLPLDENKYAGFGDSITFGYVNYFAFPERGYIPRLNTILNTEYGSQRVINEGFGGEVTADGLVRIDKVFIADLPCYLLIMEGTNDVVYTDITITSAAFNLREMVRKCLAAGIFPAIATIIPRLDWFGTQTLIRDRILSLNTRIRQIAADMSVPLVDMYAAFNTYPAGSGGVLSLLSTDLKHPSDKGYQFMAETWFSAIRMFPFPPVNVSLVTLVPEKASPERVWARPSASPRKPRDVPAEPRLPFGTLLTWAHSPKIFDPAGIQGYRLYRKPSADTTATFQLFAFIDQPLKYLERGTAAIGLYDYALSAVRKDGIEGPLSDTAGR
jgi:lysophospholipase L1-like esterase